MKLPDSIKLNKTCTTPAFFAAAAIYEQFLNNMSILTKSNLSIFLTLVYIDFIRYIATFVVNFREFVEYDEKFNINLSLVTQRRKLRHATEA